MSESLEGVSEGLEGVREGLEGVSESLEGVSEGLEGVREIKYNICTWTVEDWVSTIYRLTINCQTK